MDLSAYVNYMKLVDVLFVEHSKKVRQLFHLLKNTLQEELQPFLPSFWPDDFSVV